MPTYCIHCKSSKIQESVEENKILYSCPVCHQKSGKALIVDGRIKIINTSRGIKHIDAAAIIIRDDKILLLERRTYPYGYMLPAGHLEYDETLEDTLRREVYEEAGLKVKSATLLAQIEHPISYCRYGSDIEEWAVYLVECDGEPYVSNNESEGFKWVPLGELQPAVLSPHARYALYRTGYIKEYQDSYE